jgi:hypothetical protein
MTLDELRTALMGSDPVEAGSHQFVRSEPLSVERCSSCKMRAQWVAKDGPAKHCLTHMTTFCVFAGG